MLTTFAIQMNNDRSQIVGEIYGTAEEIAGMLCKFCDQRPEFKQVFALVNDWNNATPEQRSKAAGNSLIIKPGT